MNTPYSRRIYAAVRWRAGLFAGLAGGVAEVILIGLYAGLSGGSAAAVATGITNSVLPLATTVPTAILIGLFIHFVLACLLGLGIAVAVSIVAPRLAGTWAGTGSILLVLALVWTINFLVILPVVNPGFVHIVPMAVSFTSKLLFGLAAALVFTAINHRNPHPAESLNRYTSEEICHV
jgi:hypothetical protein